MHETNGLTQFTFELPQDIHIQQDDSWYEPSSYIIDSVSTDEMTEGKLKYNDKSEVTNVNPDTLVNNNLW